MKLLFLFCAIICCKAANLDVANQQGNSTLIIKSLNTYVTTITEDLLKTQQKTITNRLKKLGLNSRSTNNPSRRKDEVIQYCISSNQLVEEINQEINEEIKRCSTVVMAEYSNVITDSYNDVQMFMQFPSTVWKQIQRCGLNDTCRMAIVDATITETLEIPPKAMTLAAKIQSLVLRTIRTVDNCALQAAKRISNVGIELVEVVFGCIYDEATAEVVNRKEN